MTTTSTGENEARTVVHSAPGSAPRSGTAGSAPGSEAAVVKLLPSPTTKPGPASHELTHSTRFGTTMSWATARIRPPTAPGASPVMMSAAVARPATTQTPSTTLESPTSRATPSRPARAPSRTTGGT
ncbi:hypothetical protein D3C74_380900 [compost metagenome]